MLFELSMFAIILGLTLTSAQIMGGLFLLNVISSKKVLEKDNGSICRSDKGNYRKDVWRSLGFFF